MLEEGLESEEKETGDQQLGIEPQSVAIGRQEVTHKQSVVVLLIILTPQEEIELEVPRRGNFGRNRQSTLLES